MHAHTLVFLQLYVEFIVLHMNSLAAVNSATGFVENAVSLCNLCRSVAGRMEMDTCRTRTRARVHLHVNYKQRVF